MKHLSLSDLPFVNLVVENKDDFLPTRQSAADSTILDDSRLAVVASFFFALLASFDSFDFVDGNVLNVFKLISFFDRVVVDFSAFRSAIIFERKATDFYVIHAYNSRYIYYIIINY